VQQLFFFMPAFLDSCKLTYQKCVQITEHFMANLSNRFEVDQRDSSRQLILTGSTVPAIDLLVHEVDSNNYDTILLLQSLAGRFKERLGNMKKIVFKLFQIHPCQPMVAHHPIAIGEQMLDILYPAAIYNQ